MVKLPDGRLRGAYDVNKYVHCEFDATPNSGYHVARSECFNKSGSRTGSILTAQWKRDKDVWYVAAVTLEDWSQGGADEHCEVRYTEFKANPRLPEELFSIRSLKLQAGSTIVDQRPGWSNAYIVGDPEELGKNKLSIAKEVDSMPTRGGPFHKLRGPSVPPPAAKPASPAPAAPAGGQSATERSRPNGYGIVPPENEWQYYSRDSISAR